MNAREYREKLDAAQTVLSADTISIDKFNELRILIKGLSPRIDNLLDVCSKMLADLEKIQKSQMIELTAEYLPENTEEEKRRKKSLLLFLKNWNTLKSEVARVKVEVERTNKQGSLQTSAKILLYVKGPLGLITLVAVLIVGFMIVLRKGNSSQEKKLSIPTAVITEKPSVPAIVWQGKKIVLSELAARNGPDCDSPHYHAANHISVTALDGSIVKDPGGCAFGRVKEALVIDVR